MPNVGASEAELLEWLGSEGTTDFLARVRKKRDTMKDDLTTMAAQPDYKDDTFRIWAGWIQALEWVIREAENVD